MKINITAVVLKAVELPAREPYPPTQLVALFQEETGDVFNLVCSEDAYNVLRTYDRDTPVTVEATARQIDLAALGAQRKGKAYKLSVTSVLPRKGK
jgi:hypothetical protein